MVKLLQDRETLTVIEKRNISAESLVSPNFYSTQYKCLSNIRIMKISLSLISKDHVDALKAMADRLTIYTIIYNRPIVPRRLESAGREAKALWNVQKVMIDGEDYIDEFGMHVYITYRLCLDGRPDVDLRYPIGKEEPELFPVEYVEYYDLRTRKCEPV